LAEHLVRLANVTNDPKRAAALRVLAADHLVMTESGPPLAQTPNSSPMIGGPEGR
jgi:hypothetical protein